MRERGRHRVIAGLRGGPSSGAIARRKTGICRRPVARPSPKGRRALPSSNGSPFNAKAAGQIDSAILPTRPARMSTPLRRWLSPSSARNRRPKPINAASVTAICPAVGPAPNFMRSMGRARPSLDHRPRPPSQALSLAKPTFPLGSTRGDDDPRHGRHRFGASGAGAAVCPMAAASSSSFGELSPGTGGGLAGLGYRGSRKTAAATA